MKQWGFAALALALAVSGGACQRAEEDRPATAEPGARGTSGIDADEAAGVDLKADSFVEKAAVSNLAEIQWGQLAEQRARDPEVKRFARMMVKEHTAAMEQLRQAAGGAQLPATLDEKHRDVQERLSKLQGAEFDRAYMEALVDAHEDTADLLESRANAPGDPARPAGTSGDPTGVTGSGRVGTTGQGDSDRAATTNPEAMPGRPVDEWAAKSLPKVKQHLEQAKQISQRLKGK